MFQLPRLFPAFLVIFITGGGNSFPGPSLRSHHHNDIQDEIFSIDASDNDNNTGVPQQISSNGNATSADKDVPSGLLVVLKSLSDQEKQKARNGPNNKKKGKSVRSRNAKVLRRYARI